MSMSIASLLGLLFALSEVGLAIFKRAKAGAAQAADRGSLSLLWLVIVMSVIVAYSLSYRVPSLRMGLASILIDIGVVLFVAGLALRWYSIVYLGRFFTVNVAIATDHRLIDTGPYRLIRHPSYTGALMAFVGLGLCLCNWASLAAITIPTLLAFLWRMRIEEAALSQALGDKYRDYMRRTQRLIPAIY
jgi:protein-S-isoprenylcysteine O-methyltransferase